MAQCSASGGPRRGARVGAPARAGAPLDSGEALQLVLGRLDHADAASAQLVSKHWRSLWLAAKPMLKAACPAVIGRTSLGYELSLGRPVGPTAAEAAAALAAALRARGAASVESLHLKVAATDGGGRPAVLDTARLWRAALAACPAVRDLRIELRDHEWRGLVEVLPWLFTAGATALQHLHLVGPERVRDVEREIFGAPELMHDVGWTDADEGEAVRDAWALELLSTSPSPVDCYAMLEALRLPQLQGLKSLALSECGLTFKIGDLLAAVPAGLTSLQLDSVAFKREASYKSDAQEVWESHGWDGRTPKWHQLGQLRRLVVTGDTGKYFPGGYDFPIHVTTLSSLRHLELTDERGLNLELGSLTKLPAGLSCLKLAAGFHAGDASLGVVRGPEALVRFEGEGPYKGNLRFWDLSGLNLGSLKALKLSLSHSEDDESHLPEWLAACTELETLELSSGPKGIAGSLAPLAGSLRELTVGPFLQPGTLAGLTRLAFLKLWKRYGGPTVIEGREALAAFTAPGSTATIP